MTSVTTKQQGSEPQDQMGGSATAPRPEQSGTAPKPQETGARKPVRFSDWASI